MGAPRACGVIPTCLRRRAPSDCGPRACGDDLVSNLKSSVSNQIKRARAKWVKLGKSDEMRVVITAEGCSDSRADVIAAVDKRLRDGEEAVIVFDEKTIRRLTHWSEPCPDSKVGACSLQCVDRSILRYPAAIR